MHPRSNKPKIGILASDLPEAAAVAAPFVDRGWTLSVALTAARGAAETDVELIEPAGLDEEEILRLFGVRARAYVAAGAEVLIVGTDPDLVHFPAAATLGAILGVGARCGLIAPALPARGYTTENAVQMRRGDHLPGGMRHSSLVRQVQGATGGTWLHPEIVRLATVRGPGLARRLGRAWSRRTRLPICDAEAMGDLLRVVEAALRPRAHGTPRVFAGTRALGWALAETLGGALRPSARELPEGPVLVLREGAGDAVPRPLRELRWLGVGELAPVVHSGDRLGLVVESDAWGPATDRLIASIVERARPKTLVALGRRPAAEIARISAASKIEMLGSGSGGFAVGRLLGGPWGEKTVWMGGGG
ncbi:MAG: hypothetical protein CME06_08335 [Gemmatimonadetes bacterium]|nr:hypothetical protein [Gemmatimonadota bacterium]